MNWRKYLLIALVAAGCAFAPAPQSDAGVSVGIGVGFPGAYPYYGYFPYGPYPYYPNPYYRTSFYVGPSFYWYHGRRVYYTRHRHHGYWR
jgi:hypothetical protein